MTVNIGDALGHIVPATSHAALGEVLDLLLACGAESVHGDPMVRFPDADSMASALEAFGEWEQTESLVDTPELRQIMRSVAVAHPSCPMTMHFYHRVAY
jgi:hypothetical protein